ncbi:MAG: bifunctional 5,10-methylenetetrahydrofolate dehydrogenase/5,10-methenyltetrahydrofolate cyclohydrolase [Patescibacteria group bacterium]
MPAKETNKKPIRTATILDGQELARKIKLELKDKISLSIKKPGLAAILIGDNEASRMYIKLKEKACLEIGVDFHKYLCNDECCPDINEQEVLELIDFLNNDPNVDGILLQLPLPENFNTDKIIKAISPKKDADGFKPQNKGVIIPPTISSITELLKATEINLNDKKTLIIGQSDIFLDGIERYLKSKNGISSIVKAKSIPKDSVGYDIIIIALGQARALKKSMVKDGAIIIDVGINKVDGQTVGDVDEPVKEKASFISPVPGGVGPLTVACLLQNVYLLSQDN